MIEYVHQVHCILSWHGSEGRSGRCSNRGFKSRLSCPGIHSMLYFHLGLPLPNRQPVLSSLKVVLHHLFIRLQLTILPSPQALRLTPNSTAAFPQSSPWLCFPSSIPALAFPWSSVKTVSSPKTTGTPVSSCTLINPCDTASAIYSKCIVSPLINTPTAMTASNAVVNGSSGCCCPPPPVTFCAAGLNISVVESEAAASEIGAVRSVSEADDNRSVAERGTELFFAACTWEAE